MKRINLTIAAVAASMGFAFTACSDLDIEKPVADNIDPEPELIENGDMQVTFNCSMEDADATRTEFHNNTIWWSKGDSINFYQRYIKTAGGSYSSGYVRKGLSDTQESYSTTINFSTPAEFPAYYWALYPAGSVVSSMTSFSGENTLYTSMTVPAEQNPSLTSFDPAADALVSEYIEASEKQSSFNLRFRRVVALGKMTIKNLPSASGIKSIKIENPNKYIAGVGYYELENVGTRSGVKSGTGSKSITLNYTESVTANSASGMTAYFTCREFTLSEGDTFTVTVNTAADETFTKTVTIPSGREIKFEEGKGTKFNVDMSTAIKSYSWLTISDENPSDFTEGSHKIMAFGFGCSTGTVTSMSYKLVLASDYLTSVGEGSVDELYASGMTSINESLIANVNNGKMIYYTKLADGVVVPDADYYILVKLTDSSKGEIKAAGVVHSEPFAFLTTINVSSWTSGVFGHKFYGANIKSIKYLAVESSAIEGGLNNANCKKYFDEHKDDATSVGSSTINSINTNGAAGYGYIKISNTFTAGAECVELVLATMTDGSTKFCWKKQNAKS